MTPEQERKLDGVADKVGAIHTTLFGAEGQGGIHRRVERLEQHREEITVFKAKLLGMVTAVSFFGSLAGSKLVSWFKGTQ
jgi:hypothetical protein